MLFNCSMISFAMLTLLIMILGVYYSQLSIMRKNQKILAKIIHTNIKAIETDSGFVKYILKHKKDIDLIRYEPEPTELWLCCIIFLVVLIPSFFLPPECEWWYMMVLGFAMGVTILWSIGIIQFFRRIVSHNSIETQVSHPKIKTAIVRLHTSKISAICWS